MKKRIYLSIIIMVMLLPMCVFAEDRITAGTAFGTYEQAKKNIQESLRSYYMKGEKIQYNSARATYGTVDPEEATSQDNQYLTCSAYAYSSYADAFGVDYKVDEFPAYSYSISDAASAYYNANKNDSSKLNGNYLIYYQKNADSIKYVYDNKTNISDFSKQIQPGDLFMFTGHAMVAYKVVERTTGKWDVLMINATGGANVKTRINGTDNIYYHTIPSTVGADSYFKIDKQGTIKLFWLSEHTKLVKNNIIDCQREECAVIRMFYKDNSNNAVFNYSITENSYNKGKLRSEYPGLDIEKTADKFDNNPVYQNDEIEYTIKITNKSISTPETNTNYEKFYIVETLDDKVEYVSSDGTYQDGKVTFEVNGLTANDSVSLKYKVKVKENKDNIGSIIKSTGVFKKTLDSNTTISTGTVENKIVATPPKYSKTYEECYNEVKDSKTGLDLVNSVYICVHGVDYHFNTFNFNNFLVGEPVTSRTKLNAIVFKDNLEKDYENYKKMILNNLWNGLVEQTTNEVDNESSLDNDDTTNDEAMYILPKWRGDVSSTRSKNINKNYFKDGDILIYSVDYSKTQENLQHTKEDGYYAYIYLNGKFVGVNGSGDTSRNEFTKDYYTEKSIDYNTHLLDKLEYINESDLASVLEFANYQTLYDKNYYVVLRPELLTQDELESTSQVLVGVPDTIAKNITLFAIISVLLISTGSYIIIKGSKTSNKNSI